MMSFIRQDDNTVLIVSATPNENEKNNDETNVTPVTHGSDYEIDLENLMEVMRDKLKKLKTNPKSTSEELKEVEEEIRTLESLHENYDESMNVFRNT